MDEESKQIIEDYIQSILSSIQEIKRRVKSGKVEDEGSLIEALKAADDDLHVF